MSGEKAAPRFLKPGDDPELDRLLEEARRDGSEPLGEFYHDMFGRLRRAPIVAADATTPAPRGRSDGSGQSVSTGPVVTEARLAGGPKKITQSWVLALSVLGIVGPMVVIALVTLRPSPGAPSATDGLPSKTGPAGARAAIGSPSPSAIEASTTAPVVGSAAAAAPLGATRPPPGPGAKLAPKRPGSRSIGDPPADPAVKPRTPIPGSDIW